MNLSLTHRTGEPRVDSRQVAYHLGVQHESSMKLIRGYRADFEELGVLRFEIGKPSAGAKGGRPEEWTLLTEDQAYLLLAFSRNTPRVRALKVALVKAFSITRGRTVADALSEAIALMEADKQVASAAGSMLARWKYRRREHMKAIDDARIHAQKILCFEDDAGSNVRDSAYLKGAAHHEAA